MGSHVVVASAFNWFFVDLVVTGSGPLQSCTPRWQTCIGNTDDTLGFALGALFVKATFDKHSKEIVSCLHLKES